GFRSAAPYADSGTRCGTAGDTRATGACQGEREHGVKQNSTILRMVDAALAAELTALVAQASAAILAIAPAGMATRLKADQTPVTAADEAADRVIAEGLARLLP